MLVHICCSVDSHFFLQKMRKLYPNEKIIGFFYDPNIHPYSEYYLRLLDVKRSCKKLGIPLIEGDYEYERWIKYVEGFENEPEKGKRCSLCFDNRLEATAKKALELKESKITTTLLTSPKKSIEQLKHNAIKIEKKYNLKFLTPDFRTNGGTNEQFILAKKDMLYHQNYCGCIYALQKQREQQNRIKDELISPINHQILPNSIGSRIELYKKVIDCEEKNIKFKLRREKFLNYRLLWGLIRQKKVVLNSYILFYSLMKKNFCRGKIEYIEDGIGFFNKEEALFINIDKFNELANTSYKSVMELIKKPPLVEVEIKVRNLLNGGAFLNLNPIVVLDNIEILKYELIINSKIYSDVRENLVKIR